MKLDEETIKAITLEHMRKARFINSKTVIASEYVLGNSGNRIDIAIWNGSFVGIEIKSKYDSLKRLNQQISTYSNIFDEVILVAAERHIDRSMKILPNDVAIWKVDDSGQISVARPALKSTKPQAIFLADLIPLNSLKKLAGLSIAQRASRTTLISEASKAPELVRCEAISAFRRAFESTSKGFWNEIARRKIHVGSLPTLSRYHELRQVKATQIQEEAEFWDRWQREAFALFGSCEEPLNHSKPPQLAQRLGEIA